MFEYKTIKTNGKIGMLKKDVMESLGYEICETKGGVSCFKRDIKYAHNKELTSLEVEIIKSCDKIAKCERKRRTVPQIWSIILGAIACLVMGGGMSLVMAYDKILIGCIVGVIGMLLMIPPYFIYKAIFSRSNYKVLNIINEEYDKINVWTAKAAELVKLDVE